jgi:Flp pilus assembly protein TadD
MALSGNATAAVNLLQPLAAAPDALPRIRQDLALALTLGGHREEAFSILSNELSVSQANRAMDGFEALKP